jgi:HK97 family phage major capsid protein
VKSVRGLSLGELSGRIEHGRGRVADIFEKAGPDLRMSVGDLHEVRRLNDELEEMRGLIHTRLREAAEPPRLPAKDIGRLVADADLLRSGKKTLELDISTAELHHALQLQAAVFQTSAGWAPQSLRSGVVAGSAQEEPTLLNFIPFVPSAASFKYMLETVYTDAAVETAEGAAVPESTLAASEQSSSVRKVTTFLPASEEIYEDDNDGPIYVNSRLWLMIEQRLEQQVLTGDGTGQNLTGFLNVAGTNTQALGADPVFDAVLKAATVCRVTGKATPDAVVFHPAKWRDVALTRTADGEYVLGYPGRPGPTSLWGLRVIQSTWQTSTKALVGAFGTHSAVADRRGVTIAIGRNQDDFLKGKLAVRADVRVSLIVYRPAAFTVVTGL